ncbi:prepilin-type N-terminal cleavage/methylation domain-containing protein [Rubellicoccus peritrichatus]|uniref:Prepilin-type N-terminal cleavage/methylation domain-containing protein n=1 Tax=Rubellicoccus peritrichatus TaxID=3080537 RepID=A0AAQ3QX91_9BACT|nr:prepilin-type N-terminal cleavage/methylation domain-containing protein [Puniceicoccus sp. CR14]WOO42645.1 prepilin-type N-terminal cleavage/methylation domain-containing protein [Puniceicoccus sp. CR14]
MKRDKKICCNHKGMTLIELLAGIAIVGVLGTIVYAASASALSQADAVSESATARQMVTAFLLYPQDNGGSFPRGKGVEQRPIEGFGGNVFGSGEPTAMRWPWKVAGMMDGGARGLFTDVHQPIYHHMSQRDNEYHVSLIPSLGLNYVLVGGNYENGTVSPEAVDRQGRGDRTGTPRYPFDYCVTRLDTAYQPGKLIVFVSTFSFLLPTGWTGDESTTGYYIAEPPKSPSGANWGNYNEEIPASMGHVHLRHNDKAVVAHLDGSVAMLNEDELRDMTRWSNQAAKFNDPNFSNWKQR